MEHGTAEQDADTTPGPARTRHCIPPGNMEQGTRTPGIHGAEPPTGNHPARGRPGGGGGIPAERRHGGATAHLGKLPGRTTQNAMPKIPPAQREDTGNSGSVRTAGLPNGSVPSGGPEGRGAVRHKPQDPQTHIHCTRRLQCAANPEPKRADWQILPPGESRRDDSPKSASITETTRIPAGHSTVRDQHG